MYQIDVTKATTLTEMTGPTLHVGQSMEWGGVEGKAEMQQPFEWMQLEILSGLVPANVTTTLIKHKETGAQRAARLRLRTLCLDELSCRVPSSSFCKGEHPLSLKKYRKE